MVFRNTKYKYNCYKVPNFQRNLFMTKHFDYFTFKLFYFYFGFFVFTYYFSSAIVQLVYHDRDIKRSFDDKKIKQVSQDFLIYTLSSSISKDSVDELSII